MKNLKTPIKLNKQQTSPTQKQPRVFNYTYSWELHKYQTGCQAGIENKTHRHPTTIDSHKALIILKNTNATWVKKISKYSPQQSFRNLDAYYTYIFTVKQSKSPTFKKKGLNDYFYFDGAINIKDYQIKSPIFSWVERQLECKTNWFDSKITIVVRFYPYSKTYSNCQTIKEDLTLKDSIFKCTTCKNEFDRDLNIVINLRQRAVNYTESSAYTEVKPPKTQNFRASSGKSTNEYYHTRRISLE